MSSMVSASLSMSTALYTKATGGSSMGSRWSMATECWKYLAIRVMDWVKNGMKDHGSRTKCKAMECTSMHVVQSTMVGGKITNIMARELTSSPMALSTKVNGETTECTEPDFTLTPMAENGRVSIETESLKQKGKSNFYKKRKSNWESKSPKERSPMSSIPCCKPWPKAIKKHSRTTSVHSLLQVK